MPLHPMHHQSKINTTSPPMAIYVSYYLVSTGFTNNSVINILTICLHPRNQILDSY